MIDPEFTSYQAGKNKQPVGMVITGDALQNLRNHIAYQQGENETRQAELAAGSTGSANGGAGLLTVAEAVGMIWLVFHTQSAAIDGLAGLVPNNSLLVKIGIGMAIMFGYFLATMWLVKKLRCVAFAGFGLLWAYAGFEIAQNFGADDNWQLGVAAFGGLVGFGEKYALWKDN